MSWFDDLLGTQFALAGVLFPRRQYVNFVSGGIVTDNPGLNRTDIIITPTPLVVDAGSLPGRGFVSYQADNSASGARIVLEKSRGTQLAPADLIQNDLVGDLVFRMWSSVSGPNDFTDIGGIRIRQINGSPTPLALREDYLHSGGLGLLTVDNLQIGAASTADATVTTVVVIAIPSGQALTIDAEWHGRAGTTESFRQSTAIFRRVGAAAPTQVGSTVDRVATFKDDATWGTPNFAVSGNNVVLQVTGKAATVITWDVKAKWRLM